MTDDKPKIAERYIRAAHTSNLSVETRRQGDADILMAAGMIKSVGPMLLRLVQEYDAVARDIRKTAADDLTGMVLILMELRSLKDTKQTLHLWALDKANKDGIMLTDKQIAGIVGGCLTAFLSPNCMTCNGTGLLGGYDGRIQNICRRCGGSGKSKDSVGLNQIQRDLAACLMNTMDQAYQYAQVEMRRKLA